MQSYSHRALRGQMVLSSTHATAIQDMNKIQPCNFGSLWLDDAHLAVVKVSDVFVIHGLKKDI